MRYHKTPSFSKKQKDDLQQKIAAETDPEKKEKLRLSDPRAVYKQMDDFGKVVAVFDPEKDTTLDVTIAEKKEITDRLHKVDDAEARWNSKEIRIDDFDKALRQQEREQFIQKFREENGYDPDPKDLPSLHRTYYYYDAPTENEEEGENELGDSSHIQEMMSVNPFADEPETAAECMRRLIKGFKPREQTVYEICFEKGKTQVYASKQMGVSEQRVGQIVKDIMAKLAESEELKKHFRGL